jgi:hypothetical protein
MKKGMWILQWSLFLAALTSEMSMALQSPPLQPVVSSMLSTSILQRNLEMHKETVEKSENLFNGFNFTQMEFDRQPNVNWCHYLFPGPNNFPGMDATPPAPFGMEDLARVSETPLLSPDECASIIEEAENIGKYFGWQHGASRYGTPAQTAGALMPLEELSTSYTLVNFELLPRIFASICDTFECLKDPSTLRLGGARIVRYDASAGQVELGFHRDGLLLTANIGLNDPNEFTGGGTTIEALLPNKSIRLSRGHALIHPGDVRHCGAPISSGKRYVLVLFIMDTTIVPHDRYCFERGECDLISARQTSDPSEQEKLRSSAARHFADALLCGARIDTGLAT